MGKGSREELVARQERSRAKCKMYEPIRETSAKCKLYGGEGICLHEKEFLCVVWAEGTDRKTVESTNSGLRGVRRWMEESGKKPSNEEVKLGFISTRKGESLPEIQKRLAGSGGVAASAASSPTQEPSRRKGRTKSKKTYDLTGFGVHEEDGERHILKNPELLTEAAIEALKARNIEVTVTTSRDVEVVLVPEYTDQDRSELSYRDARTLVMVMQVFPGATIDEINRLANERKS